MKYNRKEYVWYRNKEWYPVKVSEIVKEIDVNNFNTVVPILKELNYPALQDEWEHLINCCLNERGESIEVVFKKYISKMWLQSYKFLTFADTKRIKQIRKEKYNLALNL